MFIDVYYINDQLDGGPSTPFPVLSKVHLFIDRASYERGGMERSYASKAASWAAGWDTLWL